MHVWNSSSNLPHKSNGKIEQLVELHKHVVFRQVDLDQKFIQYVEGLETIWVDVLLLL